MDYISYMQHTPMTVVEMPTFLRDAKGMDENERAALVLHLASNPACGDVMPGTGGVRKVRWAREGSGKRGGYRVIFYYYNETLPLFALALYAKNEKIHLTKTECNEIAKIVKVLQGYGRKS